jgi:hypothetical protein
MNILLEKSLINTHCYGMDSLVLKDGPNMIRMFIARPEHELWRNGLVGMPAYGLRGGDIQLTKDFSIAMHRHHCDVTLQPIMGQVFNILPEVSSAGEDAPRWKMPVPMRTYRYHSPILEGAKKGGFQAVDTGEITLALAGHIIDRPTFMPAEQLHTIYVPRNQSAAWYVWEGKEKAKHNDIVYSNAQLENFDFSKLDLPMTEDRLQDDLALINVRHYSSPVTKEHVDG